MENENKNIHEAKNPKSKLSFMKIFNSYFDSERSLAQFKQSDCKTRVAFGPEPNTIIILSYDGNYYMLEFDPNSKNGSECVKKFEGKMVGSSTYQNENFK